MATTIVRLEEWLRRRVTREAAHAEAINDVVLGLTRAGIDIARLLARGPLERGLAASRGEVGHGDAQKELDLRTDAIVLEALRAAPVAVVASEERPTPTLLRPDAPFAVAIDPLDGSSNIDTNAPVGTIFSVLPYIGGDPAASFLRPGNEQVCAGFLIYGPHTTLALTLGAGTFIFTYDAAQDGFLLADGPVVIARAAREYAINGSNYRHWHHPVRRYVDDCLSGAEGPRGQDFNTRWIASMVAEAYRVLIRGGVYLYPADQRPGYREGRLRLVYEANPIAWLVEQAGGAATDGLRRILDLVPREIHQRVPLVFGAGEEVSRIAGHHAAPEPEHHEPLFGTRSLFRDQAPRRTVPVCL